MPVTLHHSQHDAHLSVRLFFRLEDVRLACRAEQEAAEAEVQQGVELAARHRGEVVDALNRLRDEVLEELQNT